MDWFLHFFSEGIDQTPLLTQCYIQSFSKGEIASCFLKYDALSTVIFATSALAIYSLVWSIIGRNCSKVDQIWSITPWFYIWLFFLHDWMLHSTNSYLHKRLLLVAGLTTLWGARLTFNFARRGGYGNFISHEEDYRWPILRNMMSPYPGAFFVFNVTFIAGYQNLLLMLIALPAYIVMKGSPELVQTDYLLAGLFLGLLALETAADQEQWAFQSYKYWLSPEERAVHNRRDMREGFLQTGLFYWSRHPNYFAEQSLWVVVYLFSVDFEAGPLVNGSIIGCLLLILLFQGSIAFSESICVAKYPMYKDYQRRVSKCIPWFPLPAPKDSTSIFDADVDSHFSAPSEPLAVTEAPALAPPAATAAAPSAVAASQGRPRAASPAVRKRSKSKSGEPVTAEKAKVEKAPKSAAKPKTPRSASRGKTRPSE